MFPTPDTAVVGMVLIRAGSPGTKMRKIRPPGACRPSTRHIVADRRGTATGFALDNLQKRGDIFIEPGEDVYEGMIVGEASRPEEMQVNPTKTKQLTNIRTHSTDEAIKLRAARRLTLELAIEWIADDELVEVTPQAIRVRKRHLSESERRRLKQK